MGVFKFCGESGDALNEILVEMSDGAVHAPLVVEGPAPPELDAYTLKVYVVPAMSPGTEHVRLGAATVQVSPPGFDVTV
jgi:hypothetical protein